LILALAGGVGGAKLAHGLSLEIPPDELQIVVNTGDDFVHLGLHVSPDIDTVMYWLAGINDIERGWASLEKAGTSWRRLKNSEARPGSSWVIAI
jgi:LPPG:FO 2-phospho-L-lactate transferase